MAENTCPQCGAPITSGASECKYCGEKLVHQQINQQMNQQTNQQVNQQANMGYQAQPVYTQPMYVTGINPAWPVKSKIAAGILGILLGGLGIHKFYMGKIGLGIVYLLFSWTFIPALVGFIEGIVYLCSSDENFQLKNQVRIG